MMAKIYLSLFLFFISISFIKTSAQDNCPLEILPGSVSVKGWIQNAPPECYVNENLFEAIDGGAAVYLEYGFISMARSTYSRKKKTVDIEVYQMKDRDAAYGIFSNMNDGPPIEMAAGSIITMKSYYGMAVKGRYFIIVTEPSGKGGVSDDIYKYLTDITGKIEENVAVPSIIGNLKIEDISRLIYFKGDLVLNNALYLGITRPFNYDQGIYLETKGIQVIIFQSNIEMLPSENIYTTLERFKDSGKYTVDHETNIITNNKGVKFRVLAEDNKFIFISEDAVDKSSAKPGDQFWKD